MPMQIVYFLVGMIRLSQNYVKMLYPYIYVKAPFPELSLSF